MCALRQAIYLAQQQIRPTHELVNQLVLKPHCHLRLELLQCPELQKPNISAIRSSDIGNFVSISGTVIRTGMKKMQEYQREYQCGRCGHRFMLQSDLEQNSIIDLPKQCPSGGSGRKACKSSIFNYVEGSHVCRDYQELRVQEQVQKLTIGSIPRSMMVVVQDDLVDACNAGDDVVITGIVRRMWNSLIHGERCDLKIFIEANHMFVSNDDKDRSVVTDELIHDFNLFWASHQDQPLKARDQILRSVCPQLYGLFVTKMSLFLILVGGITETTQGGMRTRGQCHLLIVGDPGRRSVCVHQERALLYVARISFMPVI